MSKVDLRWLIEPPTGDGPVFTRCPFHDEDTPSYAVYAVGNPLATWCFGCGRGETEAELLARLGVTRDDLPRYVERGTQRKERTKPVVNVTMVRVWHRTLMRGPRRDRITWLHERGLWNTTITNHCLGHTGDRFSIPVWRGNELVNYQLRLDPRYCLPDDAKYISGTGNTLVRPNPRGYPTVICEGPLDALLLSQYDLDAVTTTGGSSSLAPLLGQLRGRFQSRVVIATDLDNAGEEAAKALEKIFPRAERITWEGGKDIGEALLRVPPVERGSTVRRWVGA